MKNHKEISVILTRILRQLFTMVVSVLLLSTSLEAASRSIPDALDSWIPWVIEGSEEQLCPFISRSKYERADNHICAWSGPIRFDVRGQSARFSQRWRVLSEIDLPLPGDGESWPQNVTVDGELATVIDKRGTPTLHLKRGDYQVSGEFLWQRLPETVQIPKQTSIISLTIDGESVPAPKLELNGLWLQDRDQNVSVDADSIDISVARRVTDGPYIRLETYLALDVSGKMREIAIGQVLPDGFELMGIEADISSFVDAEGVLYSKVQPGSWEVKVVAYAPPTLMNWQRPAIKHIWPRQEVWVFSADEALRIGKVTGGSMISSDQAEMPDAWYDLPSYLLKQGEALTYKVQHRGKPGHLDNQLQLDRTMWLSFDEREYTFLDNINGTMRDDWRFSMQAPYSLESAADVDGGVLVTRLNSNEQGFEFRYPNVKVRAHGAIEASTSLPVTGWQNSFESISLDLILPPANLLVAVFGADRESSSWLSQWSIWASFVVMLATMLAGRFIGIFAGIVSALLLILVYQEAGAPIVAIVNLLLATALFKHQPFVRLQTITRGYWMLSVMAGLASVLFFAAEQVRTAVYPQLEPHTHASQILEMYSGPAIAKEPAKPESRVRQAETNFVDDEVEKITVTGSRIKQTDMIMERYQSDALIQAGSGIPNWRWRSHNIRWNNPVTSDQRFEILVLSSTAYRIIKLIGVALTLLWLYMLLKPHLSGVLNKARKPGAVASVLMMIMIADGSQPASASEYPDQALLKELKNRVLAAPDCAPVCATINQMMIRLKDDNLRLEMQVHAEHPTALALPRSELWQPQRLLNNGAELPGLSKRDDWIYMLVDKGVSTISVEGEIAPVDAFQLQFKERPMHVQLNANPNWDVGGIVNKALSGNTLEFVSIRRQEQQAQTSRYPMPPLVKITRQLTFDQTWEVYTEVERIAPMAGSINIPVPVLSGEHPISSGVRLIDGTVPVVIGAGESGFSWRSVIQRNPKLTLKASADPRVIEKWELLATPAWHMSLSELPQVLEEQDGDDYVNLMFYPQPGESLDIELSRLEAVEGSILAVDEVLMSLEQGTRSARLGLSFSYRSTRGAEHSIHLPEGFSMKELKIDGEILHLQPENHRLTLPIAPGDHRVELSMRSNDEQPSLLVSPEINLNAPISNITSVVDLSPQRWVLWVNGPRIGPAVLYWGEFIVFLLLAVGLARIPFSPLNTGQWLLLGLGLSLNNWGILMLVAFWFLALTLSGQRPKGLSRIGFNFSQLILFGLSVISILSLVAIIPMGLLGTPDMGITGNASYGNHLQWFMDKSTGALPTITVLSIPTLFYKGLMLAWVIWLSFSMLGWVRWAWRKLGEQGYWRRSQTEKLEQK